MSSGRAEKNEKTDQKKDKEIRKEDRRSNSEQTAETKKQVQLKQPGVTGEQKQKEKIQAFTSAVPSHKDFRRQKWRNNFPNSWKYLRKYKLISLFQRQSPKFQIMPNFLKIY